MTLRDIGRPLIIFATTLAISFVFPLFAGKQTTSRLEFLYAQLDQAKREKKWTQVVELASSLLRDHPDSGRGWYRLGGAEENLGHFARAQEALQQAANLNYDRRTSLKEVAELAGHQRNAAGAIAALRSLVAEGFDQLAEIEGSADLALLRSDPGWPEILAAAKANVKWQASDPRWSKDGAKIIYARGLSEFPPRSAQIFMVSSTGGRETQLTYGPGIHIMPDCSPDGRKIVYSYAASRDGRRKLRIEDLETHQSHVLVTEDLGNEHFSSWSPDGKQIAFNADSKGHRQVYVVNVDGSGLLALTKPDAHSDYARWNADGTALTFESDRVGMWDTYVTNVQGSEQHRIAWGSTPSLSHDGERFVFDNMLITGIAHIYVMDADGTHVKSVGPESTEVWEPEWSPDGKQIVFMSRATGRFEICIMNADGTQVRQVTHSDTGLPGESGR